MGRVQINKSNIPEAICLYNKVLDKYNIPVHETRHINRMVKYLLMRDHIYNRMFLYLFMRDHIYNRMVKYLFIRDHIYNRMVKYLFKRDPIYN